MHRGARRLGNWTIPNEMGNELGNIRIPAAADAIWVLPIHEGIREGSSATYGWAAGLRRDRRNMTRITPAPTRMNGDHGTRAATTKPIPLKKLDNAFTDSPNVWPK